EQFAQEQPILLAALGVAFGAALGASLPLTRAEQQYVGGTAKQAMNKSSESENKDSDTVTDAHAGQNVGHKVSEGGEAVSDQVTQGLSGRWAAFSLVGKTAPTVHFGAVFFFPGRR